jgi:outer membrane protein
LSSKFCVESRRPSRPGEVAALRPGAVAALRPGAVAAIRPAALCALLLGALPGSAFGIDVFNTAKEVSPGPATPLFENGEICPQGPASSPLPLFEAIERSLCESPQTRAAWISVKAAAAVLGESKAAYLPQLAGTAGVAREHEVSSISRGPRDLGVDETVNVNTESLQLAWILFDFGGRAGAVANSRQLLIAAQANQNEVLQSALAATARDYYATQAAHAQVEAAQRIETDAQQSLAAAQARYTRGVAPVTDQLQANTAYAQAVYQRAASEGAQRTAMGGLAVDMSLPPDQPLSMPAIEQGIVPDERFVKAVHDLIDEAEQSHPAVLAAAAQYQAALDSVRVARSQGLPTVSLQGSLSRLYEPLDATIGTLDFPSTTHSSVIGLQISVPLFSGFSTEYKIRAAQAVADQEEQLLRSTRQQVSTSVWSSFQALQTATENLKNTSTVRESAQQAFEASRQRYRSGVGNILELLTAQSTLSGAELQYIQSQLDWRIARLQLAASLGQLGMWAVK